MNLQKFKGPGSTPSRRRLWDSVADTVIASQKIGGHNVTVTEYSGQGTLINIDRNRRTGAAGGDCPGFPWYSSFEVTFVVSGTLFFCKPTSDFPDCGFGEQSESIGSTTIVATDDTIFEGLASNPSVALPFGASGHVSCSLFCPCPPAGGKGGGVGFCNFDDCRPAGNHWWLRFIMGFSAFTNSYPGYIACGESDPYSAVIDFLGAGAGSGCEWTTYGDQVAPQVSIGGAPGVVPYGTYTGSFGMIQGRFFPPCTPGYIHFGAVSCNWTAVILP